MTSAQVQRQLRVLVVANEPPWPSRTGGRVRIAGLAQELSRSMDIVVAHASPAQAPAPPGIEVLELGPPAQLSAVDRLRPRPRIGVGALPRGAVSEVKRIELRVNPDFVLYSHSYLAAVAMTRSARTIVDFPNLEVRRLQSLARDAGGRRLLSGYLETLKARLWEPRVARAASIVIASTEADCLALSSWGAEDVIVVPNAVARRRVSVKSPVDGPVLFVSSAGYAPNDLAGDRLVRRVWPLVRSDAHHARLVIVGRGTDTQYAWARAVSGVEVVGEVEDIEPYLYAAALVVAPVESGGGTQLKVIEALAAGRAVVATPYSAGSAPRGSEVAVLTARSDREFADSVIRMLRDPDHRHRLEAKLADADVPTWPSAVQPLLERLRPCGSTI